MRISGKKQNHRFFGAVTVFLTLVMLFGLCPAVLGEESTAVNLTRKCSTGTDYGSSAPRLYDGDIESAQQIKAGKSAVVSWKDSVPVRSLYVSFYTDPTPYEVKFFDAHGTLLNTLEGALQWNNLYEIPAEARKVAVTAGAEGITLSAVELYGEGEVPNIHDWNWGVEKADLMVVAMHPDDDVLFLGAIIPTYGAEQGKETVAVYLGTRLRQRRDEAMNGAWVMGLRNQPVFGGFPDIPNTSEYMDKFKHTFKKAEVVQYLVEQLRRYRPEVVVSQDTQGEYGHWQHVLMVDALREAVPLAADGTYDKKSAEAYGTWEVKKLYLHLFGENKIELNVTAPLSAFGGRTAVEVATEAFTCHSSQTDGRHSVKNEGIYSLSSFGLAYTTVGTDTPGRGDMFENVESAGAAAAPGVETPAEPEESPQEPAGAVSEAAIEESSDAPAREEKTDAGEEIAEAPAEPVIEIASDAPVAAVPVQEEPSAAAQVPENDGPASGAQPWALPVELAGTVLCLTGAFAAVRNGKRKGKRNDGKAQNRKKRQRGKGLIAVAAAALILIAALLYFNAVYVLVGTKPVRKDTEILTVGEGDALPGGSSLSKLTGLRVLDFTARKDVTGETVDACREAVGPDCEIKWNVPLTDGYFDSGSEELTLPNCTAGDVASFSRFPGLKRVNAGGSAAYEALLRAEAAGTEVTYTLPVGGKTLTNADTALTVTGLTDLSLLTGYLKYFPKLTELMLLDCSVSQEQLDALRAACPGLTVTTVATLDDGVTDAGTRELDLSGRQREKDEVAGILDRLPLLETVNLCGTGLTGADVDGLRAAYPKVRFVWDVVIGNTVLHSGAEEADLRASGATASQIGTGLMQMTALKRVVLPEPEAGYWVSQEGAANLAAWQKLLPGCGFVYQTVLFGKTVSTDAEELDLSGQKLNSPEEVAELLKPFQGLRKAVLCGCGLTDLQMETLMKLRPEVRFVWEISVGTHTLRTDAVAFSTKNPSKYTNANASAEYNRKVKTTKRLYPGDIDALKYCTDLVALDLGHNYLSNEDLKIIAGLTNLQILILADNKLTDVSALRTLKNLSYVELFMNNITDVSPLSELTELVDVNVCNNDITDFTPLTSLPKLNRLWYSMCKASRKDCKAVAEAIKAKLPDCTCDYTTSDETGDGWREHPRYTWMHAYFYGG